MDGGRKTRFDEHFVWRWICRIVVLVLVGYWIFNDLTPNNGWILFVSMLLGLNEFRVKRGNSEDDESYSISLGRPKKLPEPGHKGEGESTPLRADRYIVPFKQCRLRPC